MSIHEDQPTIVQQPYKDTKQTIKQSHKVNEEEGKKLLQQLKKQQQQQSQKIQTQTNKVFARVELDQEKFFAVMDLVDQYDKLVKQMNEEYCAGMLLIANVKFINPYTSLSTKGYKPTPVITKISIKNQQQKPLSVQNQQKQHPFTLVQQTKNIKFTNSVIESINKEIQQNKNQHHNLNENDDENEQVDSQSAHSSMSTANQLYSYEQEELIMEEQQVIDQCRKHTESKNFSLQDFIIERFSIETQKSMVSQASIKFYSLLKRLLHLAQKKIDILRKFDKIQKQIKSSSK